MHMEVLCLHRSGAYMAAHMYTEVLCLHISGVHTAVFTHTEVPCLHRNGVHTSEYMHTEVLCLHIHGYTSVSSKDWMSHRVLRSQFLNMILQEESEILERVAESWPKARKIPKKLRHCAVPGGKGVLKGWWRSVPWRPPAKPTVM